MTAAPDATLDPTDLLEGLGDRDRAGLATVLNQLDQHGRADPASAARVAVRCEERALASDWRDLAARARYLRAQWCALEGRIDEATGLLDSARVLFDELGMVQDARRTCLGRAHLEMLAGRPDRAQDVLEGLIEACASSRDRDSAPVEARAHQNLGAVLIHRGMLEQAIEHFRRASEVAQGLGDERMVLEVTNNEGVALLQLGRAAEAIDLASGVLAEAGEPDRFVVAQIRDTLGRAQLVGGELAAALTNLADALSAFEAIGLQAETGRTMVALGDAYLACNLIDEARVVYTRALDETDADSETAGWAALGAAQAALEAGDRSDALTLGEHARATFACSGSAVGLPLAHLTIGRVELDRGSSADATAHGRLALATATEAALPVEGALAELFLHDLDGDTERLEAVGKILATCEVPSLDAALHTRVGDDQRSRGDVDSAAGSYRTAIAVVERQRGSLAGERHRRLFMASHSRPYDRLQDLLLADGEPSALLEAFQLSEMARARALVDAMGAHGEVAGSDTRRELVDLVATETLRLGADGLVEEPSRPASDVPAPTSASGAPATSIDLPHLQAELDTTTYVAYTRVGCGLHAYVVDRKGLRRVALLESIDELARPVRELDAQMARMRSTSFAHRWPDRLVDAVNRPLATLHQLLIAPLELDRSDADVSPLLISPSAEIHGIPFAALRDGDRIVIDDYAVATTPSATAWLTCGAVAPATGLSKVFAHATSRLPDIRLEGVDVARALAHPPDLAMTERARCEHALSMSSPHIAHFACHGRFRARQPMMSTLRLIDGDLTAHELASVDLTGSLVVLSACESGRGAAIAGPEVLGFERAALMAGARSTVTSRWLVHDGSTRALMARFHAGVAAGRSPALALRAAQLDVRADRSHPYHWAAFACTGAGFEPHTSSAAPSAIAS